MALERRTTAQPKRIKKQKLFHDEEPSILDVKQMLTKNDQETRTSYGRQIIETVESRQPLSVSLRRKLIHITCHGLMNKTNSNRPSTDQREQLAQCVVNQLFSYMGVTEKCNLQQSYFTPSSTYKNEIGKKISKRPMGYIQSFFVNFWHSNKTRAKLVDEEEPELDEDMTSQDEAIQFQDWLKMNRGPIQKVFELMNKTYCVRKAFLKQCSEFSTIISSWPRLFDIDGAIQNDFNIGFPLIADNLFFNWKILAPKIMKYGQAVKRSTQALGIPQHIAEENMETAAIFLLPFLIRPKNKRVSQVDSSDSFIKVLSNDLEAVLQSKEDIYPQIVVLGNKANLVFEEICVVYKGKGIKCSNILEAIDLAFKSFYVFNIEFPSTCYGAWQFLDYGVYKMKLVTPLISGVTELTAYVCNEEIA